MTAQDRRALAAGLPRELLLTLMRARRIWWEMNDPGSIHHRPHSLTYALPPGWWQDEALARAIGHPAAGDWDGVFVAAMRRELG